MKIIFILLLTLSSQNIWGQKKTDYDKKNEKIIYAEFPQKIIISVPKPEYPKSASSVNASGKISVEVIIDQKGNVESAKAVSGHPLLHLASEQAALKAKFKPTTLNGKTVRARTYLIFDFISEKKIESIVKNDEISLGEAKILPKPPFPFCNCKFGTKPQVLVQIEIDENGNVISAKAISGHPILRAASETAARNSKFSQTKLNDFPIKAKATLFYEFNLDDSEKVEVKSIEAIKPN